MKIIIFILLLINSVITNASNWIYVGKNNSGATFFVDTETISRSGDSVTFWGITNYSARSKEGDLSNKAQRTINCRTRELIFRYYMFYDDLNAKGKLTMSFPARSSDVWEPIAPDTLNEFLLKAVCGR